MLVQLGPKECLIPTGERSGDANKLGQVLNRSGVLVVEKKKCKFYSFVSLLGFSFLCVGSVGIFVFFLFFFC